MHDISAPEALFVTEAVSACGALKKRESLLSGKKKMSFNECDKHFTGSLYTAPGLSPALKHVAAVRGNTAGLSEPPLFRLQVNSGKLYANVTFS